ncbi:MAG: hypothetical protein M3518_04555 [Actinomycetota bacterium]|nr:hypothetical protein [Actinomycetota bacterium]
MRSLRYLSLLVAMAALFTLAACGSEGEESQGGGSGKSEGTKSEATAGSKAESKAAETRGDGAGSTEAASKGGSPVELDFGGDPGTRFTATCAIGQEERKVRGEVPDRIVTKPGGKKIECDILKRSTGMLEVTLVSGDDRHEQRTDARWSKINLIYSDAGFFSSVKTSSAASGSSQSSVSSASSSSTSSSSSASSD